MGFKWPPEPGAKANINRASSRPLMMAIEIEGGFRSGSVSGEGCLPKDDNTEQMLAATRKHLQQAGPHPQVYEEHVVKFNVRTFRMPPE
eukprot:scaffold1781_cov416-Prasinococcus_capsulatus_cf.AAC.15